MEDQQPLAQPSPVPKVPDVKPKSQRHRVSVWRLGIGLCVVLFGLQLLANNFGWQWLVAVDLWRLWPVVIILVGISIVAKGHIFHSVVGGVLSLAVVAVVIGILVTNPSNAEPTEIRRDIAVARETQATSAAVTVDMGAASVHVSGSGEQAASGNFTSTVTDLTTTSRLDEDVQRVDFTTVSRHDRGWMWLRSPRNTLNLQLQSNVPTDFSIDSGAANLDLDFREILARRIDIDAGASRIDVKLGDAAALVAMVVQSGASSIDVYVPKAITGVRVSLDAGLSGKTIPAEIRSRSEGVYETDGYETAEKKVDLSIDAGASGITIHWE